MSTPESESARELISRLMPRPVVRGVGRIVPVGADPESIPLPEVTPLERGPNARPDPAPGGDA